MANRPQDWIVAASCSEGPRPALTFADLPPEHRRDMIAVVFAAALSSAFVLGLAIRMQPIPSRSLAGGVRLPNPAAAWGARFDPPSVPDQTRLRRPPHPRVPRPLPAVQLASESELPPTGTGQAASAPQPERRRNAFSRFVHGFLRATPSSIKPAILRMDGL